MSDLYRSAIQSRLARLPPLPIDPEDEGGDEEDEAAVSIGALPSSVGGNPIMWVDLVQNGLLI